MRSCRAFWLYTAEQQALDVSTVIANQLEESFGEEDYYGAAAATPWEALLLVKVAREKGFRGMIHFTSRLGRNILRALSWEIWWESCHEYAFKKNIPDSLVNRSKNAMALAMQRLGCARPDQLRSLPGSHLCRRFGAVIAEVWQISFP